MAGHWPTLSPDSGITTRILAGCTTGAMAVTCAQPTDVVKVRFQATIHLGPGSNQKYNGTMDAYRTIAREEGVRGLWKGKSGLQYQGPSAGLSLLSSRGRDLSDEGTPSIVYSSDSENISRQKTPPNPPQCRNSVRLGNPSLCAGYWEGDRNK